MLLLLGFRPVGREQGQASLRRSFVILLVLLVVIAVPLGFVFAGSNRESRAKGVVEQYLAEQLGSAPGRELVELRMDELGEVVEITALVYAADAVEPAEVERHSRQLGLILSRPVRLRLATIAMLESQLGPTAP